MTAQLSPEERARLAAALGEKRDTFTAELELTKLYMRCGPRARREFLRDVRAASPELWAEVSMEESE